jgi:hypothetical protein
MTIRDNSKMFNCLGVQHCEFWMREKRRGSNNLFQSLNGAESESIQS